MKTNDWRVIKRLLLFLLITAMLSGIAGAPVFAIESEEVEKLFCDDFSVMPDGALTAVSGWSCNSEENVTINDGFLTLTSGASQYAAERAVTAVSGLVTVEAEYDMSGVTAGQANLLYAYGDKGIIYSIYYNNGGKIRIRVTEENVSQEVYDASSHTDQIKIKTVIDTISQRTYVYCAKSGEEYPSQPQIGELPFRAQCTNVNKILFGTGYMTGTAKMQKLTVSRVVKNNPPIATEVMITEDNGVLTGSYNFLDADGDAEGATKLKWLVKDADGSFAEISGEYSNSLQLTQADDGKVYKFSVTPVDEKGNEGTTVESAEFVYTYTEPIVYEMPTAVVSATTAKGPVLIGNYQFTCDSRIVGDDIDQSEYQWYISDNLFGQYTPIAGATNREFTATKQTEGKFLKFHVIPVDKEGNRGKEAQAFPVLQTEGIYLDFEDGYELTEAAGWANQNENGTVTIVADPENNENSVVKVERISNDQITDSNGITIADYRFSSPGPQTVITVDLYVDCDGTSELFYIFVSGLSQAYKVYTSGNTLRGAGGDGQGTQISETIMTGFQKNTWHQFRFDLDASTHTVDCYVDGILCNQLKGWRANGSGVSGIRSYLQGTNLGKVYMDNLQITAVADYSEDVLKDKEALNISADLTQVMTDLTLRTVGENGSTISWQSSNPSVISDEGKVTRPAIGQPNAEVELTAYIMKGTAVETKSFSVNVLRLLNDKESVETDAGVLNSYQNMILDSDIELPESGANGTVIEWHSSMPDVLANDGQVTRGEEDFCVMMTAAVTKGTESVQAEIPFYILRKSPQNLMKNARLSVSSQSSGYAITNINDEDLKTSWKSASADAKPEIEIDLGKRCEFTELLLVNAPSISGIKISISDDGTAWSTAGVFNAAAENRINRLDLSNGVARYLKLEMEGTPQPEIYELRLYYEPSDDTRVDNDYNLLELDVKETVKESFQLPVSLANGSSVKWSSSNDAVIQIDQSGMATVTRSRTNVTVTLTAEISYGESKRTKIFRITVAGTGLNGSSISSGGVGGGTGSFNGSIPWQGVPETTAKPNAGSGTFDNKYEFSDLSSVPWAIEEIEALKNRGIIHGVSNTEFAPNLSVTREEFVAMIVRAMNLSVVDDQPDIFTDVTEESWYYSAVMSAYQAGIVKGKSDGSFGVGESITREDMAVMLYRCTALPISDETSVAFKDLQSVSDYAKEAVICLAAAGIIKGDDEGFFRPASGTNRAEAAVVIYRLFED